MTMQHLSLPYILLIVSAIVDIATTVYAMKYGAVEANPLMRKKPKLWELLALKLITGGLIWYFATDLWVIWFTVAVWFAISLNNLRIAHKLRKGGA